jgi:LysR family transcriptional regulator of gallate degradation
MFVCERVARLGNISAASRHVHLSQPAVTQAVSNVEAFFGAQLFVRHSAGVALTPAGEIAIARIARARALLLDGIAELQRRHGKLAGAAQQLAQRLTGAQLKAFAMAAEQGSFSRAARANGVASPTLYRAARALERALDVPLFEKTSFGVRATREAESFGNCVRLVFSELDQARADIDTLTGGTSGRTVIGAMPLARSFIVPSAVTEFIAAYPRHCVSIVEGTYEYLLAGLQSGDIDFLIGALRPKQAAPNIEQEHLFDDPLSVVMRHDHPLAKRRKLRAEDLTRHPWIAPRTTSPLYEHFKRLFTAAGVPAPAHPVECNSLIAARAFLLESDCLMLSSTHQVHYELRAGLLRAVPHPHGRVVRPIGLAWRRNWQATRAQQRLLELIRERARSFQRTNQ